jgi:hypothetical protein
MADKVGPDRLAAKVASQLTVPTPLSTTIPNTASTPASAFDVTALLPLDGVCDLTGVANPQTIWLKYTIGPSDFAWSVWATGEIAPGTFHPGIYFYDGIPADPDSDFFQEGSTAVVEGFIEDSIDVAITGTLYIRIINTFGGAPTLPTTVYVDRIPNTAVPVNAPIINNDISGYPATILSPTGDPSQIRSFVAGESGAMLANGVSLWSDATDHTLLKLFDADLALITTVTWPSRAQLRAPISSNGVDTFWVGNFDVAPAKINTVTAAGVLGSEITLTTFRLHHVAPSMVDVDILYLIGLLSVSPFTYGIWKYHLASTTLDAAPFITEPANYSLRGFYGRELVPLSDGRVLVMLQKDEGEGDSKVTLYDTTGAVVRDFPLDDNDVNHIALGADGTTFWVWTFTDGAFDSQFIEFRISDGVRLQEFTLPTTTSGSHFSSDPTSPSSPLFGVPECCPMVITRVPLPPYGPPPPTPAEELPPYVSPSYFEDPRIIRRLRRAPHLSQENVRVFYRKIELDLERGVGLPSGQGADPLVMLRLSRDGGHTWSEPVEMSAGQIGVYTQRVIARRLGAARDTVFEVTVSDPVAWSLVNAWLDLEAGTS